MSLEEKIALQIIKLRKAARNLGETTITIHPEMMDGPEQPVCTTLAAIELKSLIELFVDATESGDSLDAGCLNKRVKDIDTFNVQNPIAECQETIN